MKKLVFPFFILMIGLSVNPVAYGFSGAPSAYSGDPDLVFYNKQWKGNVQFGKSMKASNAVLIISGATNQNGTVTLKLKNAINEVYRRYEGPITGVSDTKFHHTKNDSIIGEGIKVKLTGKLTSMTDVAPDTGTNFLLESPVKITVGGTVNRVYTSEGKVDLLFRSKLRLPGKEPLVKDFAGVNETY